MSKIFRKMMIGKKLLVTFLLVTILSSCSGVISLFLMSSADIQYSNALENYGFSQGYIGMLMTSLKDNNASVLTMIASDDPVILQQAQDNITQNYALIDQYLESIHGTLVESQELDDYNQIVNSLPGLKNSFQEVINLSLEDKNNEALNAYESNAKSNLNIIEESALNLMNYNRNIGSELSSKLTATSKMTIVFMALLILVSVAISVGLALYISRSISKPMADCSRRLLELSKGNLTDPVPVVHTQDETGILSEATAQLTSNLKKLVYEMTEVLGSLADGDLNINYTNKYEGDFAPLHISTGKIIDSLNNAFIQFKQSADQVSSGADQVSGGAQALSQGATEQASSIEELAATINGISSQISNNADNAISASKRANEVASEVLESNRRMQSMLDAMNHISVSSDEIAKIIKTIEDIAFQTNILALNAAVEAARAGQAGKGFAVVADEVRNLASKSSEASKSTALLIEDSLKAVSNGKYIADETANSLNNVVTSVKEVVETIEKISDASREQANSSNQISQGIEQISSVVHTNSATAEESAAASEELSGQAQIMRELISRFKIKGEHAVVNSDKEIYDQAEDESYRILNSYSGKY